MATIFIASYLYVVNRIITLNIATICDWIVENQLIYTGYVATLNSMFMVVFATSYVRISLTPFYYSPVSYFICLLLF